MESNAVLILLMLSIEAQDGADVWAIQLQRKDTSVIFVSVCPCHSFCLFFPTTFVSYMFVVLTLLLFSILLDFMHRFALAHIQARFSFPSGLFSLLNLRFFDVRVFLPV